MNLLKHPFCKILGTALILWLACCGQVHADKDKRVLIIANAAGEPYLQTINGFKQQLSLKAKPEFVDLLVNDAAGISAEIKGNKPDLIFSLGGDATELALQNTRDIPVVATLILSNTRFKSGNVTGVNLSYPWAVQFQWLKKFFPNQKNIAVLYNPAENAATIQAIQRVASQSGLELKAIPVEMPRQLPDALDQLAQNVEVLFSIPDEVAMSPKTAKEVLLASFRNKVPLIGLSDNWVKSGALYALSWDYDDLGKQCAEQAEKLLNGQVVQKIPAETPRKLVYTINTKIAEHMGVDISDSLLKNAQIINQ